MDLIYDAPPRPGLVGLRPITEPQSWRCSRVFDVRYFATVLQ